ncbi:FAD/NAD(P)-binding domain-containing protein [Xylariaceae sp. FL0804]|nr:FAD/NAD(P)-binding domain-containing protein [Xylariaceae sp. FL0804]
MPSAEPSSTVRFDTYPRKADLLSELYLPLPTVDAPVTDPAGLTTEDARRHAQDFLGIINEAVASNDAGKLSECFFSEQAFWRDQLALTSHVRTFKSPATIASAFLETAKLRELAGIFEFGHARYVSATPSLHFLVVTATFRTGSPAAVATGRFLLLPIQARSPDGGKGLRWRIWILTTWLEELRPQAENEDRLQLPGRDLSSAEAFDTDVLIIGGGNAAATLAARLKAMNIESVMLDRNRNVGDNWNLRYDCMRLHVPTASCEMPYMRYEEKLQSPHLVKRTELAEHLKKYVATFKLNMITSASIKSTIYDKAAKLWHVKFATPNGLVRATCKHLVQATGIGSQKPYVPRISDAELYQGISIHSAQYKSGKQLKDQGVESVVVVGSANTAFDIVEDCHAAGLRTTMIARSPTYLIPLEYAADEHALGAYDVMPIQVADEAQQTLPIAVEAQLVHGLCAFRASQEPDRYEALAAAGFPVFDSRDPRGSLTQHLLERAGGHYVDLDHGTRLITDGAVAVRGRVEPVAYNRAGNGLRLDDGSDLAADAVVWCTGFADRDMRDTAAEILSGGGAKEEKEEEGVDKKGEDILGPRDIAARMDATWALDEEGELRGMWKRHLRVDNFWVMGGHLSFQRWWSRLLALQIKMALDGTLPPAYRKTPQPAAERQE